MDVEINGMAHVIHGELLLFPGLTPVIDSPESYYCVGGRTALGLRPADPAHELHRFLVARGARIVHAPEEAGFAPGYYSVFFEDPDGIRLEANLVPGRGLLEPGVRRGT